MWKLYSIAQVAWWNKSLKMISNIHCLQVSWFSQMIWKYMHSILVYGSCFMHIGYDKFKYLSLYNITCIITRKRYLSHCTQHVSNAIERQSGIKWVNRDMGHHSILLLCGVEIFMVMFYHLAFCCHKTMILLLLWPYFRLA